MLAAFVEEAIILALEIILNYHFMEDVIVPINKFGPMKFKIALKSLNIVLNLEVVFADCVNFHTTYLLILSN